mgnify:CR=1 FL=1
MTPGGDGSSRMLALVAAMAHHLESSAQLPGLAAVAKAPRRPRRVLLCGLGGSAVAGDVARPLLAASGLETTVWRDYGLPSWLGPDTLIVLSSYSGETEETLSAARGAIEGGLPAVALTSGGSLAALVGAAQGERRPISLVTFPGGLPPRAALGHSLGALLWLLHRAGAIPSPADEIAAAVKVLHEGTTRWTTGERDADGADPAELARALLGRFTVIYTTSPEAHGAGLRLKAQLNENAKHPAYTVPFPELDHNDIVGWEVLRRRRDDFSLVIVRGGDEHPRTARRVAATRKLLAGEFHAVHEIAPRGTTALARMVSLVQFADYLSCRLAQAAGVDPLPVARIDALKAMLADGEGGSPS